MSTILAEILVLQDEHVVHVEPVGPNALFVGRTSDNDLIIPDPVISARHVVFHFSSDGRSLHARDLGSTNGTWVNDKPLSGSQILDDGDEVRLGSVARFRVRIRTSDAFPLPAARPTLLVDLSTGIGHAFDGDEFALGPQPSSHLRIRNPGFSTVRIKIQSDGQAVLYMDDERRALAVGEPFHLGGRAFVLRTSQQDREATVQETLKPEPLPRLLVHLGDGGLPEANLESISKDRSCVVTAGNRVALLYVLARRRIEDRRAGLPPSRAGWCADEEVMLGIWGKAWENQGLNNYQVLLSRLRKEIREGGFDPSFIEKRARHTRVSLEQLVVTPP